MRLSPRTLGGLAALAAVSVLKRPAATDADPIQLHDVTSATGIAFRHTDGSSGRKYIVETVASGLATFDFDGDGLIDVYFLNGRPLRGTQTNEQPTNRLYKNLGGFRFVDVTDRAGVGDAGYGLGVAVADYDNDGHPDIYVSNFGPKVLYHNNGDGTFTDVTKQAGVADGAKVGAGACFFDMDGDGNVDLYVANYVDFTYENHVVRTWDGLPIYPGPTEYRPMRHTLYRNNGDGAFTDVSEASGIAAHPGTGMGTVCVDFDNDGDADVFVLNDVLGNFCFENDGKGHFAEVATLCGFKYNGSGMELGSMGIDACDFDGDGWIDLFQTSYESEQPVLFQNLGGMFEDATARFGAGQGTFGNVKWGCAFVDFDNNGHRDLFVGMGNLHDNVESYSKTSKYEATNVLLRNTGNGGFEDVSKTAGDALQIKTVTRGVACDDLDNDGRIDVAILASRRPALVFRNESPSAGHWLQVSLQGVKTNRDGVGARVRVVAGDLIQIDEVHSGRGYQSHFGSRLHFGLGSRGRIDRIEVRWTGGGVDVLEDLAADQLLTIREGGSPASTDPLD